MPENTREDSGEQIDIFSLSTSELRKELQDENKTQPVRRKFVAGKQKAEKSCKKNKAARRKPYNVDGKFELPKPGPKGCLGKEKPEELLLGCQHDQEGLQLKFACGSAGYDLLLEQGQPLPSRRNLCRRLQHLTFLPGVLAEILTLMKAKVAAMSEIERDCVLFLDELEIRRGVELDRSSDCFLGKITLPESDQPANHALVFMVGGLNTRWKQVIAYHYTGAFVSGDKLKDFVFHLIQLCTQISLRVVCVTCDMGSSNRSMWRSLNLSSSRSSVTVCSVPHPCDSENVLYFMPDPAHVLKNLRGHLVRKDVMHLNDAIVARFKLPSNEVSIAHVEAVLKLDTDQLQVASNLSNIHISNGHFTKMKVGIAVQLFREAPAAIRYYIEIGKLSPEAETTAWFFGVIFKWFTIMTARHPSVALSLKNESKYEEAIAHLKLTMEVIEGLGIGVRKVWKPSQAGVLMSTTVVLQLHIFLLKERRYSFVLTGRMVGWSKIVWKTFFRSSE